MLRSSLLAFVVLALGCGSAPPPPKTTLADAPPVPEKIDTGPTSMEGEIGGMNEEAMDNAFASLGVAQCIERGSEKIDALGGEFKLKLRIDKKGSARWAYLAESTLGDRDTEKCLIDLARAKNWPKPVGGDGLAEKTYAIDPPTQPLTLDEKRVRGEIARARAETAKCRRGVDGSFVATVYVKPDGHVESAGVAVPSEKGEDVADCVVEALMKVRFRAPTKPAKVSFELR